MFSDTHFHYEKTTRSRGTDGTHVLRSLLERKTFFAQDIGTNCDDLPSRVAALEADITSLPLQMQEKARAMIYLSAGIWPSAEAIAEREQQVAVLQNHIRDAKNADGVLSKVVSIGECGLDRHWNKNSADVRNEADFSGEMLNGECELFEMQILLAKKLSLPVIVHSRDAAEETLSCIKNCAYDNGIIHCFSYGKKEAEAFLNRGWYISFSGSITYTKKSQTDAMRELLNYIPKDRILFETDSPYLAPVPLRGSVNNPENVQYVYQYAADMLLMSAEELSEIADKNIKTLYGL